MSDLKPGTYAVFETSEGKITCQLFPEQAPEDLYLTEIVNQQKQGREMVLTVANWNRQKQAILETFHPESCTEVPMTLEDIFIKLTGNDSIIKSEEQ